MLTERDIKQIVRRIVAVAGEDLPAAKASQGIAAADQAGDLGVINA